MRDKIYRQIDPRIKSILLTSEGWLVGKAIHNLDMGDVPDDYDIIVPSREIFQNMVQMLTSNYEYKINSYGGIKLQVGELSVDMWCEELSHFLVNAREVSYVFNYKKNLLFKSL